ncbi:MAG: TerB family tellurite resistance protein [Bacteroidales bacterium]|nr:TerB family tellurite resistance protein [Bacteroidales bacterium]
MGLTKWILTGLGFIALSWTGAGPLGALLGYYIGSRIERDNLIGSGSQDTGTHHGPYRNTGTQDDVNVALIVLIAAVMKADGTVRRSELDYVKRFLLKNYGEELGKQYLSMLRDLVQPERVIETNAICYQIKQNTDYTTRYHMVDVLFGLAVADGSYSSTENSVMRAIASGLGINSRDYLSMYTRHVGARSSGSGSSYSGGSGYSGSSRSSSYSTSRKDPYKVLGISSNATDEEVKKAYRRMAMKYHPDKVETLGEEVKKNAEAQVREINEAYEQIKTARGMK